MSEEVAEISAPKNAPNPRRMRRYIRHLSSAMIRAEDRSQKKQAIKSKLENIRSVSLNKRSTKQMIESELGSFEDVVHDIIHDEEKILAEQRKETKQITELKNMVENLSKKLIDIGKDYAKELEIKDKKIMELREALAAANIKLSESGQSRKDKIAEIEKKMKGKNSSTRSSSRSSGSDHIRELESHLKSLEARHRVLKKQGKHPKADLDRIQSMIDKHKAAIKKAKSK